MKLKPFIITIIAFSFAMIGLLGGCSGNSNSCGSADEKRDETLKIIFLTSFDYDVIDIYLLPDIDYITLHCYEKDYDTELNFTAKSSNDSIVSVVTKSASEISLTSHNPGTATVKFTTEDGRNTWFNVTVVGSPSEIKTLD